MILSQNKYARTCLLAKICQEIYEVENQNLESNQNKVTKELIDEIDHLNMNLVSIDSYSKLQFIYLKFYQNTQTGKYLLSKIIQKLSNDDIPIKIKFIYLYSQQFKVQDRSQKLQNFIFDAFQLNLNLNKKLQVGYKCGLVYLQHIRQLQVFCNFLNKIIVYLKSEVDDIHAHYLKLRKANDSQHYSMTKKVVKKTLRNRFDDKKFLPKFNQKTKSQKLPFYQLLLQAYNIGNLKIKDQSKNQYYFDCLNKLQRKLLRDYPGKFMQQSFDIIKQKVQLNYYILKDQSKHKTHSKSISKRFYKERDLSKTKQFFEKQNAYNSNIENSGDFRCTTNYKKANNSSHINDCNNSNNRNNISNCNSNNNSNNCNELSMTQIKIKNMKSRQLIHKSQFSNQLNSQQKNNLGLSFGISLRSVHKNQPIKKINIFSHFRMRSFSKKTYSQQGKYEDSFINQPKDTIPIKQSLNFKKYQENPLALNNLEQLKQINFLNIQTNNQIKTQKQQKRQQAKVQIEIDKIKQCVDNILNKLIDTVTNINQQRKQKTQEQIIIENRQYKQINNQYKKWKNNERVNIFGCLELKISFNLILSYLNCQNIEQRSQEQIQLQQQFSNQIKSKVTFKTYVKLDNFQKQLKIQRTSKTSYNLEDQIIQQNRLNQQLQQTLFNQRTQIQQNQCYQQQQEQYQKNLNDQQIYQQSHQNQQDNQQNKQIKRVCSQMVDYIYDCICCQVQSVKQYPKQLELQKLKQSIRQDQISSIHSNYTKIYQSSQKDLQIINFHNQSNKQNTPMNAHLKLSSTKNIKQSKQSIKKIDHTDNLQQKQIQLERKKEKLKSQISILSKKSLFKQKTNKTKKIVKINKKLDQYEKDFILVNFSHYYQPKLQVSYEKINITITEPISHFSQSKLFEFPKISRSSLIRKLEERAIKALNKAISLCSSNDLSEVLENINIQDLKPKQIEIYAVIASAENEKFKNIKFIHDIQNKKVYSECLNSSLIPAQIPIREDQTLERIKDQLNKNQIKVCYQQTLIPYLVVFNLWCSILKSQIILKSTDKHKKKLIFILQDKYKIHMEEQEQDEDSNRNGQIIVHDMQVKIEGGHDCLQFKNLSRKHRNKIVKNMSTVVGYYLQIKNGHYGFRQNTHGITKMLDIL